MTEIGRTFANIAESVKRLHGFGSNKMVCGYTVYEDDGFAVKESCKKQAEMLEQLVQMGYLSKFVTKTFLNNKTRNWRYRFMVRNVCFGLTKKGWEVAPKYIAILDAEGKIASAELKAKNYCEKVKNTNRITYEEAFELAMQGEL